MFRAFSLLGPTVLISCSGDVVLPSQGAPKRVTIVAGQGQQGAVADTLTDSLVITVTDGLARPMVQQPIALTFPSGGSVASAGLRTDNTGRLALRWVLGPLAGSQTLEIGIDGSGHNTPEAVFTADAAPGPPAALPATDANVGDGKVLRATSISIQSRDAYGNVITTGGYASRIAVTVTGANNTTAAVTDNGDGTYAARYTPTFLGTDNVSITIESLPIKGSPFKSDVGF